MTLFPGVRINFSKGGISTTIGIRGASVNIGSRGTYLNLGLPGSGLSYRTKIGSQDSRSRSQQPTVTPSEVKLSLPQSLPPAMPAILPREGEIRSAEVSDLTSDGLDELKNLINQADESKRISKAKIGAAQHSRDIAALRFRSAMRFIIRLFLWSAIPARRQNLLDLDEKISQLKAQHAGCYVDLDFGFDQITFDAYHELRRAYDKLRTSSAIWDVVAAVRTDRVIERTVAGTRLDRTPVRLSETASDLLNTNWLGMKFENANGEDIFIYPGFAMMREPRRDFALIDLREVSITYSDSNFLEEERIPYDAITVGKTWAKTNKDGSPDRRFRDNYQIPIVRYGRLAITSGTGLNEAYMFSNASSAQEFAEAFAAYRRALTVLAEQSRSSLYSLARQAEDEISDEASGDRLETDSLAANIPARPKARVLFLDLIAIIAAVSIASWLFAGDLAVGSPQTLPATSTAPVVPQQHTSQPSTENAGEQSGLKPVDHLPEKTGPNLSVTVKVRSANIRTTPDKNSAVVSAGKSGDRFSVFKRNGEWLQVGDTQPLGWIHSSVVDDASR